MCLKLFMRLKNWNKMHSDYSTSLTLSVIWMAHCIRWTWIEFQLKLARKFLIMCVAETIFQKNNQILLNISHRHSLIVCSFYAKCYVSLGRDQIQTARSKPKHLFLMKTWLVPRWEGFYRKTSSIFSQSLCEIIGFHIRMAISMRNPSGCAKKLKLWYKN